MRGAVSRIARDHSTEARDNSVDDVGAKRKFGLERLVGQYGGFGVGLMPIQFASWSVGRHQVGKCPIAMSSLGSRMHAGSKTNGTCAAPFRRPPMRRSRSETYLVSLHAKVEPDGVEVSLVGEAGRYLAWGGREGERC